MKYYTAPLLKTLSLEIIMSSVAKTVYFIRHGQSTFNEASHVGKLYPNADLRSKIFVDAALTPTGEQQALEAKAVLHDLNIEVAITSPFQRALQTCQLAHGEENVVVNHLCGERLESACDIGSPPAELKKLFPALDFSDIPKTWWYTGVHDEKTQEESIKWFWGQPKGVCEPDEHLASRIHRFHQFLSDRSEKKIAVFSHSMFLREFLHACFGRPIDQMIRNCEVISYSL